MVSIYNYLDQLIDEKIPNPIENWWTRYLIHLHTQHKVPYAFLPKKAKNVLCQWEDEMKGGECYGCRQEQI